MDDERTNFEANEIRGLAKLHGAKRVEVQPGVYAWQFPRYVCQVCGPDRAPQPGCPSPLSYHGQGG